jgi:hypothetical protein
MSAQSDRETIAELRAALDKNAGELALLKAQFGDAQTEKARKAQEQQYAQFETVIATSAAELSRFEQSVEQAYQSLLAVAHGSALDMANGVVGSRPDAALEVRRLGGVIADNALAAARKRRQHEVLEARRPAYAPPPAPKPTSFEKAYYEQPEGNAPIEAA